MHRLHEQLLHHWQVDGLLVATLAFHTGRDTADDDDGISHADFLCQIGEVGEFALADVTTEHGELSVATTVFDHHIIGLASLYGEAFVVGATASEAEASETTTTTAALVFLHDLAVDLQDITVVSVQGVLHLTGESSLVLTCDAHGEIIVVHTFGKAPGSEGGEVELIGIVIALHRITFEVLVVPELHEHTLAIVEVLDMVYGGVFVVQLTGLVVDNLGTGDGILDTLQKRVLVVVGRRATVVTVQEFHIVGIRTQHGEGLDAL